MSYKTSTPAEIQERLEAEASITSGTQHASIPGTPENIISRLFTIAASELYGYVEFLSNQIVPSDKMASAWLDRHAGFWLKQGRKASVHAYGPVIVTGISGTVIEANSIVTRADGQIFTFTAAVMIGGGGTVTGEVTAANAGIIGNTASGLALTLSSPVVGVASIVVGADGLSGGTNNEGDISLLDRVLARVQNPPHGGAVHDYIAWAREVPGVTRAWAKEGADGVKTVLVTFVMDGKTDTIVPTLAEVESVEDYISGVRPAGAAPEIFAPVLEVVNLQIAINPNTVAVQNAIRAELEDFFSREATAGGGMLYYSRLSEAVSIGAGEYHHRLISPAASLSFNFGTLPVLGEITWSAA